MKKVILNEDIILHGYFPKHLSKVDFKKINKLIKKASLIKSNLNNKRKDLHLGYDKNFQWLVDYVIHKLRVEHKIDLELTTFFALHHKKNETTVKRNHLNYPNLKESSDFVCLYCQKGKGLVTVEYSKNRKKDLFHEIPIDENKFIIFNSPLEYYISPNENKNNRTILCMELKDAS